MRRAPLALALALALALGAPALHAQPLPSAAYNAADWQLAWQAFLGNGDVESAYRLARAAVAARPHSILWHQRLAAAAEQSDHARDALEAYYWLVTHAHRHEYLGKALGLAEGLDDPTRAIPLMRIQLRARPYDERLWSGLIGELLKLGDYARALQLLQAADRKHPRRFFLWEQAVLYHQSWANPSASCAHSKATAAVTAPSRRSCCRSRPCSICAAIIKAPTPACRMPAPWPRRRTPLTGAR
ncbi:tetratricopeptide repeat protein [Acidihalobacter prosperus]|uniref:Uncharacterized protein n=1 Tax=Acidihalobacter prosperus TaxID=160660 RepID=A0A1A6C1Q6_9GAMM|nr:hypothetical protein [Acidihalobacter prosperus]OBS08497.1 hypothetical protein Thpro_022747 [Acidihalobacter prosperus]